MSAPATESGEVAIEARDVVRSFGARRRGHLAVRGVDVTVSSKRMIGVVGESGSGKSTLARLLVGLDTPTSGTISYEGRDLRGQLVSTAGVRQFRRAVQFVAQDTLSSFDPRWTLRTSVRLPAERLRGLDRAAADAQVDEILTEMGIDPGTADRYPTQVSGGQRQRYSLARALVVRPRILVCDEVVSALDVSVQAAVLNLLKRYCTEHECGIVFVSHGLPATAFIADELIVMNNGAIVESGPTDEVVRDPQHEYTAALVGAYRSVGGDAPSVT